MDTISIEEFSVSYEKKSGHDLTHMKVSENSQTTVS